MTTYGWKETNSVEKRKKVWSKMCALWTRVDAAQMCAGDVVLVSCTEIVPMRWTSESNKTPGLQVAPKMNDEGK
jgi:hypothetical protein